MYSSAEDGYDYDHSNWLTRDIVRKSPAAAAFEPQGLGLCSYRIDGSGTRGTQFQEQVQKRRDEQYRSYLQLLASTVFFAAPEETTQKHFVYAS